ncbi:peptidoglycan DD-metalloendopeptidase family protein [Chitinophaga sp. Cy-1792]|uniref:peptidoglycan DD-metalloendopeptidase family protein n=1 Tax=Chitinophaga sp. Cy-1792 TaxID=2608339 RepID=UPI00141EBCFB|nr:peptidoglycan DD-metalloendopeptidase family protein [Chitinophaga sp. Cy-1792]NIG51939.1 peptidoglycan DD-metalloendopeptidase family protein [Chitinophaga sp. Cy-1792]
MLQDVLLQYQSAFQPVIQLLDPAESLMAMDFTRNNTSLTMSVLEDLDRFCRYIDTTLTDNGYRLGIGGYAEHRTIYAVSPHFDAGEEPRRLHLGIDVWGLAGTPVFAPLNGHIHSFRFNDHFGDYGATIILQHQLDGYTFHTLYGHLSITNLQGLYENMPVTAGQQLAFFGVPAENGGWPPHLHFQVIEDMGNYRGDYPGVCRFSEKEKYLRNCPDPDLLMQLNKHIR